VEEVFKQVRTAVRRDSKNQQTPWENTALEGQFYFKAALVPAPPVAVIPAPVPAPPTAQPGRPSPTEPPSVELALWESVKASTVIAEVQLYIDRYPRGAFGDLAKARIAGLQSVTLARTPSASEFLERGNGRLTIKDGYSDRVQSEMDVFPSKKTAEATTFSSGDVIAANGEVLAMRLGPYVGTVTSGRLWVFPLKDGMSGRAEMSVDGLEGGPLGRSPKRTLAMPV
jgi:hypothetical protein